MGWVGFTRHANGDQDSRQTDLSLLRRMQQSILHEAFYTAKEPFCDSHICTAAVSMSHIKSTSLTASAYRTHVFFEGELYNQGVLRQRINNRPPLTDAHLLLDLYRADPSFSFLRYIDGSFVAAVYDETMMSLSLVSDRYGHKSLYWGKSFNRLFWGTEVKVFLPVRDIPKIIDPIAIQEFFGLGYLLENRTWYKDVQLVPMATVITWDLHSLQQTHHQRYWWWDDIQPASHTGNVKALAEEMGTLFINAVNQRCNNTERIGVMLSGGLDSRAIFAAIPDRCSPIHTFTWGQPSSSEVAIASDVSRLRHAEHHLCLIDETNWFDHRFNCVHYTDGHLNILHMHAVAAANMLREFIDTSMHSFAGDLILGGSYLSKVFLGCSPADVTDHVLQYMSKGSPFCDEVFLREHLQSILAQYSKTDYFFLNNRVRRFTLNGSKILERYIVDRKPTFDNQLIEFCYSVPDKLRHKSFLYNQMLLASFPKYYQNIPRNSTGLPISASSFQLKRHQFEMHLRRKLSYITGWNTSKITPTFAYDEWVRSAPIRNMIEAIIFNPGALWASYLPRDVGETMVKQHMTAETLMAEKILALVTFEVFLQRQRKEEHALQINI